MTEVCSSTPTPRKRLGNTLFGRRPQRRPRVAERAQALRSKRGGCLVRARRRRQRIALQALLDGGGHEGGLRSGTINVPAIVGFGRVAQICGEEMTAESGSHTGVTRSAAGRSGASAERHPGQRLAGASAAPQLEREPERSRRRIAARRRTPSRHMCFARSACRMTSRARRSASGSAGGPRPTRSTTQSKRSARSRSGCVSPLPARSVTISDAAAGELGYTN